MGMPASIKAAHAALRQAASIPPSCFITCGPGSKLKKVHHTRVLLQKDEQSNLDNQYTLEPISLDKQYCFFATEVLLVIDT